MANRSGRFVTGTIYVPTDFSGLRIEYDGDSFVDSVDVSAEFDIAYY